jgi:hypothetical protein
VLVVVVVVFESRGSLVERKRRKNGGRREKKGYLYLRGSHWMAGSALEVVHSNPRVWAENEGNVPALTHNFRSG